MKIVNKSIIINIKCDFLKLNNLILLNAPLKLSFLFLRKYIKIINKGNRYKYLYIGMLNTDKTYENSIRYETVKNGVVNNFSSFFKGFIK